MLFSPPEKRRREVKERCYVPRRGISSVCDQMRTYSSTTKRPISLSKSIPVCQPHEARCIINVVISSSRSNKTAQPLSDSTLCGPRQQRARSYDLLRDNQLAHAAPHPTSCIRPNLFCFQQHSVCAVSDNIKHSCTRHEISYSPSRVSASAPTSPALSVRL
jgi:hypothetical protein